MWTIYFDPLVPPPLEGGEIMTPSSYGGAAHGRKRWVDDDDDDDEIAYFTVRWKASKLVLSTAPKTWNNTDKDSKNRKRSH